MQKKNELSFLNIIFCLLVIFIHISSEPVTALSKESWQYRVFFVPWRLSAFVVQGFIFLSGLKMFLINKNENYIKYCLSRFKKIVIPYVFSVVMFYAYFLWRNYFDFSIKDLMGYILKGDLVSHFYFVIIIVQFYILKPIWKAMLEKINPVVAIILSVVLMFFFKYALSWFIYNDRVFTSYLTYWVLGCYVGKYYDNLLSHIKKYKSAYISQFSIFALAEGIISYIQFAHGGMILIEELHFVYCISAILFTLAISTGFCHKIMSFKLVQKTDNASYYIYLIHPLFIFIVDGMLHNLQINDIGTAFVIRGIVTYVMSVFLSVIYLEMKGKVKRNKSCRNSEKQK